VKINSEKGERRFQAEVLFMEHFGSMNIVNLQVKDKIFKARTRPTLHVDPKDKVWIDFDEDRMIFFDKESEKALKLG
jgi:ABC-type sugar transport system ATPase subunit